MSIVPPADVCVGFGSRTHLLGLLSTAPPEAPVVSFIPHAGVRVVSLPGGTVFIHAAGSDTVASIRNRIHETTGVEIRRLVFEGRALEDVETLTGSDICVDDGPTLYAMGVVPTDEQPPNSPLPVGQLRVKALSGGSTTVEAKQDESILDLKRRLQSIMGVPVARQRLLFEGAELLDHSSLRDSGVSTGQHTTLYLIPPREALSWSQRVEMPRSESPSTPLGSLLERRIDGAWYQARVLRDVKEDGIVRFVDLQYLDDGNLECRVDVRECRYPTYDDD